MQEPRVQRAPLAKNKKKLASTGSIPSIVLLTFRQFVRWGIGAYSVGGDEGDLCRPRLLNTHEGWKQFITNRQECAEAMIPFPHFEALALCGGSSFIIIPLQLHRTLRHVRRNRSTKRRPNHTCNEMKTSSSSASSTARRAPKTVSRPRVTCTDTMPQDFLEIPNTLVKIQEHTPKVKNPDGMRSEHSQLRSTNF